MDLKEYFRQYYKNNKERLDTYHKEYVKQHRKEIKNYNRNYYQQMKLKSMEERKQKLLNEIYMKIN